MNEPGTPVNADIVRDEIDRELELVQSAARLVGAGGAVRVTLVNLPLAGEIIDAARAAAETVGARVYPLIEGDEGPHAVAIEPEHG